MSFTPAGLPPPRITGYEYVEPIAVGGYSAVYKYRQLSPQRDVAVKVLTDTGSVEDVAAKRDAEANAMVGVASHPNIVQVITAGATADGRHYIVMQYYRHSLRDLLRLGPLNVRKVVRVAVQLAGVISTAHRLGWVHHDIKPANILIDDLGQPRLTDFGIAGRLSPDGRAEVGGLSPLWSPPEIISGGDGSTASDVYSLGATLWTLLVGRSPFEWHHGDTPEAIQARIVSANAPPTGRADVPHQLEFLLARMLAKGPGDRPASADLIREFSDVERACGGPAPEELGWHAAPDQPGPEPGVARPAPIPATAPGLADTSERRRPVPGTGPVPGTWSAPAHGAETLVKPAPATVVPEPSRPARSRTAIWLWAVAVAVVAAVATGIAVVAGSSGGHTPTVVDSGGGQDAGNTEGVLPGAPVVTAKRLNPRTIRFSWNYPAPQPGDTFRWQTPDGARTGTAKKTSVDLPDPAGTQLCLQIMVIRVGGAYSSTDWSQAGCGE